MASTCAAALTEEETSSQGPSSLYRKRSREDIDPESTVEAFLTSQRDKLVSEMESLTGMLVSELQEDCTKATDSLREDFASLKADGYALRLRATTGPHVGSLFDMEVFSEPCYMGRSSGKKFKANGVSLPKDGEVSTTHAKIVINNGHLAVVDVGSTNGTTVDGNDMDEHIPAPISQGSVVVIGSTSLTVVTLTPLSSSADPDT